MNCAYARSLPCADYSDYHIRESPAVDQRRLLFQSHEGIGLFGGEIWQTSFYDRRVRDIKEYYAFREYIHLNPVKRGLASLVEEYPYSSARPGFNLDGLPQRLKPVSVGA